jgi:signal transduction histidine kinase
MAVRVAAVGEAVTQLPWLSPCGASLLALARAPAAVAWEQVRYDPGAMVLIVRRAASRLHSPALSFFPALLGDPAILEGAVQQLSSEGVLDWEQAATQSVLQACWSYASLARRLADASGFCDPDNAWIAGLVAPLGWLAVCAAAPEQAAACLADPELPHQPARTQRRHWGLDQAAIARRLARSWRLPHWLARIIGHLGLPLEIARRLGLEAQLFHVVQTAVAWVQERGRGLHLSVAADAGAGVEVLGLTLNEVMAMAESPDAPKGLEAKAIGMSFRLAGGRPLSDLPLLADVLRLAADNLRLRDAPGLEQVERERDELQESLESMQSAEADRLQTLKLEALAEFAAGAAHEINNPLAVISGQAQYLLGHEMDPARQRAMQTIISQAQRVHKVLTDVMQFARPAQPQRQPVDVHPALREVNLALSDLAERRQIALTCSEPDRSVAVYADPRQFNTVLECLLRNAIEAAPAGGWARLHVEAAGPERVDFIIEDNGAGLAPGQHEHLFDPFYSGRQAGRGRGLGLPTAWRLAREQGGEVRFDGAPGSPTRFVLSLPRADGLNGHP